MKTPRLLALAALPPLLAGCAMLSAPPPGVDGKEPAAWQAPLPAPAPGEATLAHDGKQAALVQWWRRQHDPVLVELINAAQQASPSVAAARTRIAEANAARVAAGAALLPALDATASAQRRSAFPPAPGGAIYQGGAQASWELDLFGANWMARKAAVQRLQGAEANWHAARVSVAAEVANQYYGLRSCQRLLEIAQADAASRAETARLTELAAEAGFQSPASAALARASAAEGSGRATQQRAQCEIGVKALVTLTAVPEPELREKLANASAALPEATLEIASLPAATLAQRPDVFAAAREVAAASADVGASDAQRYPRLSLTGAIGKARFVASGVAANLDTWSVGPLSLTLPLFDGGRRSANLDAARARYEEAATNYRATVRGAVREVEEALVRLDSTAARSKDAKLAVEGFATSFKAVQSRHEGGMASLFELEDARRSRFAAESALAALQYERIAAWISLYRAAGGGWNGASE